MGRFVKDFIDVTDQGSLDGLIERLIAVRDGLPDGCEAAVRMRGDDVFGRKLSISFQRPQTAEEEECDARYAEAYRRSCERDGAQTHAEPAAHMHMPPPRGRRLKMVA